jgi:hypothetical protein
MRPCYLASATWLLSKCDWDAKFVGSTNEESDVGKGEIDDDLMLPVQDGIS